MTSDPLPNTPPHEVLLHAGLGDHQVSQYAAEVEARTIGAYARTPWADPGRDTDKGDGHFRIPAHPRLPVRRLGDGAVGHRPDPHEDGDDRSAPTRRPPTRRRRAPARTRTSSRAARPPARVQKSEFLRVDGRVMDVCGLGPCYAGSWTGP